MDILNSLRIGSSNVSGNGEHGEKDPASSDDRCPRSRGTVIKATSGIALSILALGIAGVTAAANPQENLIHVTSGYSASAAPAYEVERISASDIDPYTLTSAVSNAPFATVAQLEAAQVADLSCNESVCDGTQKHSYLDVEAVQEAAAEREAMEEEEAEKEGAVAVKANGSSLVPVTSDRNASKEEDIAKVRNEKLAQASSDKELSSGKDENSASEASESSQSKNALLKNVNSDASLSNKKQKLTVSGTLMASLDAAAAEKKDQEQKAAQREEEARQAYLNSEQGKRDMLVEAAYSRLGVPYVWGGTDPDGGMDCSGFTQWCYSTIDIDVSRTSESQYGSADEVVPVAEAEPGDILYSPGHVAIYIGDGAYIHEPQSGDVCKVAYDLGSFSAALKFL